MHNTNKNAPNKTCVQTKHSSTYNTTYNSALKFTPQKAHSQYDPLCIGSKLSVIASADMHHKNLQECIVNPS